MYILLFMCMCVHIIVYVFNLILQIIPVIKNNILITEVKVK